MITKNTIKKVLKAQNKVEKEIRQDGNTPDDFSFYDWIEMISEDLK